MANGKDRPLTSRLESLEQPVVHKSTHHEPPSVKYPPPRIDLTAKGIT